MVVVCWERMDCGVGGTASGRNGRVQWTGAWVGHAEGKESKSAKTWGGRQPGCVVRVVCFQSEVHIVSLETK